jgi:hypothetical protein
MAFSDGTWWLTGGLDPKTKSPTTKTFFYDKTTQEVSPGLELKVPQAGHCIVEVAHSFVSSGGFTKMVNVPNFIYRVPMALSC